MKYEQREQNNQLHPSIFTDSSSIIAEIELLIKNRVSSLKDSNPDFSSRVTQIWFS